MKPPLIPKRLLQLGVTAGILFGSYALITGNSSQLTEPQQTDKILKVAGTGSVSNLQKTYQKWSEGYAKSDPKGPVMTMMWTRGLSSEFSNAKGIAQLNFEQDTVSVRVKGIKNQDIADVWLVDNLAGAGRTILPESGDNLVKVGTLQFDGDKAWLDGKVENLANFQVDMIVLAHRDSHPGRKGVLYGTTSLFQKIFHYPQFQQEKATIQARSEGGLRLIKDAEASGITPPGFFSGVDSDLLNEGRRLFFEETFNGNGRTCGTCHIENDNLALSLKTIASLPDDDPLFIVEQQFRKDGSPNPLFNDFRMEKPALMRKLGLIFENTNGFIDPDTGDFTTRGTMRSPNHVLSVRTTLAPPPAISDDGTLPVDANDLVFAERTGWSGDGTPTGFRADFFESNGRNLTGALRDFSIGAIVQHFTRSLERSAFSVDGSGNPREPDFRFATEAELDAMEAFMLSIGQQEEKDDLNTIRLKDEVADRGRLNYMGFNVFNGDPARPVLSCNSCHLNGGANTDPTFAFSPAVTPNHDFTDLSAAGGSIPSHNRSFNPNVERLADQAGDVIVQVVDDPSVAGNCFNQGLAAVPLIPGDGPGAPSPGCDANPFDNGFDAGFGDTTIRAATNRFNAPPVFEAADNPPFFHGHQINTIEGAVAFYATNRHLRNGDFLPAIVPLNGSQVANVARFVRVMGADFNISSAIQLMQKGLQLRGRDRRTNTSLALAEIEDAIELLDPVDLHIQDAVPLLKKAARKLGTGKDDDDDDERGNGRRGKDVNAGRGNLRKAIALLRDAQDAMVTRGIAVASN